MQQNRQNGSDLWPWWRRGEGREKVIKKKKLAPAVQYFRLVEIIRHYTRKESELVKRDRFGLFFFFGKWIYSKAMCQGIHEQIILQGKTKIKTVTTVWTRQGLKIKKKNKQKTRFCCPIPPSSGRNRQLHPKHPKLFFVFQWKKYLFQSNLPRNLNARLNYFTLKHKNKNGDHSLNQKGWQTGLLPRLNIKNSFAIWFREKR